MDDGPEDRVWIAFAVLYTAFAVACFMLVFLLIKGP
jgi:hypothetical protein